MRFYKKHFDDLLLSIMATEDDFVEVPICYKKLQNLQPRLTALIIDICLVNFCKTIFVTLACFVCLFVCLEFSSVRLIYLVL